LIGVPLRITVGGRSLKQGGVELKRRTEKERALIPLDQVVARVKEEIADMEAAIAARVVEVELPKRADMS
ncbi:MAG: proline--tRNA ligase, partial [Chloroflexi bacterium]|nr:proline--tRNA ligase [Chloroflexota bacterium]